MPRISLQQFYLVLAMFGSAHIGQTVEPVEAA